MEGIARIFTEVMQDYGVAAEEIDAHEKAIRGGGYAALLQQPGAPGADDGPPVICRITEESLKSSRSAARGKMPADGTGSRAIDTEQTIVFTPAVRDDVCSHLDRIRPVMPGARGCEECLKTGDQWVHLRLCLTCGHVGCCDSSPNKHATAHFKETDHPLIKSIEPGEDWGWCYRDEIYI
jgi:hypothetical protein